MGVYYVHKKTPNPRSRGRAVTRGVIEPRSVVGEYEIGILDDVIPAMLVDEEKPHRPDCTCFRCRRRK